VAQGHTEPAWSSNGRRIEAVPAIINRLVLLAAFVLAGSGRKATSREWEMTFITRILIQLGILRDDIDYHVVRASMVIIFLFIGYQKWFNYTA